MMGTSQVQPVEVFPNTSEAILEYLNRRTMDTVGVQVRRADAVVVGVSGETGVYPLPAEQPAQPGYQLVTRWTAERWLVGQPRKQKKGQSFFYLVATRVLGTVTGESEAVWLSSGQRALLFLSGPRQEAAVAALPQPVYSLAPGADSTLLFQEETFDERGRPVTRDHSAEVDALLEAVEWYLGLPAADTAKRASRRQALLSALDHNNPHIAHCALRSLIKRGDKKIAQAFRERLPEASDAYRQADLLVGLWLTAPQADEAGTALEELLRHKKRTRWLAHWDIRATPAGRGKRPTTLYAPQATPSQEVKDV